MSFAACQLSCSESHLWNKIFFSSHISNGWGLPHLHWETLIAVNDAAKDEHVASHLCVSKTQNMQILAADHEHSTWKFCDTYNSWGGFLTRSCEKRVSGPSASRDVVPNAVVPARFFLLHHFTFSTDVCSSSPDCSLGVSTATEENLVANQLAHLDYNSQFMWLEIQLCSNESERDLTHSSSAGDPQLHLFRGDLGVANLKTENKFENSCFVMTVFHLHRCSQESLDSHPLLENTDPGACNTSLKLFVIILMITLQ